MLKASSFNPRKRCTMPHHCQHDEHYRTSFSVQPSMPEPQKPQCFNATTRRNERYIHPHFPAAINQIIDPGPECLLNFPPSSRHQVHGKSSRSLASRSAAAANRKSRRLPRATYIALCASISPFGISREVQTPREVLGKSALVLRERAILPNTRERAAD